ncbi:MAG TPA: hypothetical protein VGB31_04525, partial [Myxococcota bacterium]
SRVGVWGTRISTRDGGVTWSDHSVPVTLDHALFAWLSTEDQAKVRESAEDSHLFSVCFSGEREG